LSTSAGLTTSNWQIFFQDDDSTIGAGSNSGQNITGQPTLAGGGSFSFVVDLTDGNGNTGAQGWGPGTLDSFRFDPFQSTDSFGESMTISAITFGSAAVPEPSTISLLGIGMLLVARRRRV
jgi:hypothetical protein